MFMKQKKKPFYKSINSQATRKIELQIKNVKICILGLGYVGLPLAVEFGKKYRTVGFDINTQRLEELKSKIDGTLEVSVSEFSEAEFLTFTNYVDDICDSNVFIVTVPTPIDQAKKPDMSNLIEASKIVGKNLCKGDVVIFESTVYPGASEEICVPVLERFSNLRYNLDFFIGYSPERINPGDKTHRLTDIVKVTSGSNELTANFVDELYGTIIKAGTHKAPSIRVAEAAKVIENTQRDVNIALINELAMIFAKLEINTKEVLNAASTKWNFLPFQPGLVGGHCIGVDPYYLTHKAQAIGYNPEIILAGRRLNDNISEFIATQFIQKMLAKKNNILNSRVLIMGLTFKEDCPDLRNSKVIDVVHELQKYNMKVDVHDPWVQKPHAHKEFGINLVDLDDRVTYDGVIVAVGHRQFREMTITQIRDLTTESGVVYDLKSLFDYKTVDIQL